MIFEIILLKNPFDSKYYIKIDSWQGCRKRGAEGAQAPQFLVDQLTLSQPGGAHSPHPVLRAPPDFQTLRRPCLMIV